MIMMYCVVEWRLVRIVLGWRVRNIHLKAQKVTNNIMLDGIISTHHLTYKVHNNNFMFPCADGVLNDNKIARSTPSNQLNTFLLLA